jgi:DNA-binding XRE family transcriptional regulator
MVFSERLKILRILCGFTQETLAELAGASRISVIGWERSRLPARRAQETLAQILHVSPEFLTDGIHPPTSAFWHPVQPGHPRHLKAMAVDLQQGIPPLFRALKIGRAVHGYHQGQPFWLCGDYLSLNYLIFSDRILEPIISDILPVALECEITYLRVIAHHLAMAVKELTGLSALTCNVQEILASAIKQVEKGNG